MPCRVVQIGTSRREQSLYGDATKFSFSAKFIPSKRRKSEASTAVRRPRGDNRAGAKCDTEMAGGQLLQSPDPSTFAPSSTRLEMSEEESGRVEPDSRGDDEDKSVEKGKESVT